MSSRTERQSWYSVDGSGGQGIVIDEDTGRNVAVTYDSADAPIVAAAPFALEVCRNLIAEWEEWDARGRTGTFAPPINAARAVIEKVENP